MSDFSETKFEWYLRDKYGLRETPGCAGMICQLLAFFALQAIAMLVCVASLNHEQRIGEVERKAGVPVVYFWPEWLLKQTEHEASESSLGGTQKPSAFKEERDSPSKGEEK